MKTAAFVPIKLNSQRLPGKNLMNLNGRPLCCYIFQTLSESSVFDQKYVYCSDERIKAHIPEGLRFLKRDPCLDRPETKGTEIIERFIDDVEADVYMITHATQPFTKGASFEHAMHKVCHEGYDSAFSAVILRDYCWYGGKPLNYDMDNLVTTQELEPVYMETGAFFIFKKEVFTKKRRRIGDNPYIHIVDSFEAIDIDTMDDFVLAEAAAQYISKSRGNF